MLSEAELNALISLLDDDDPDVCRHVAARLEQQGKAVIPILENTWSDTMSAALYERIQHIIANIQQQDLLLEFKKWGSQLQPDLFTGAALVSKYFDPDTEPEKLWVDIQKLKRSIWIEFNYHQTPLEQIHVFNHVFYNYHGFSGVQHSNQYRDFCLNHVLQSRRGTPISVGIVYLILCAELNIPVYGVPLFRHFIMAYCHHHLLEFNMPAIEKEVLFYINPVHNGMIFSRNEIKEYLEKLDVVSRPAFYTPIGTVQVIKTLLTELIELLEQTDDAYKVEGLQQLLNTLD